MPRLLAIGLLLLSATSYPPVAASQIVLNEYLAAIAFGIEDEDGDHEDWIELYNAGASSANLAGGAARRGRGILHGAQGRWPHHS
jgi:hypothetical protein